MYIVTMALYDVLPVSAAQQPGELQRQLQELKQQYEETTQELQRRIATLEQQVNEGSETERRRTTTVSGPATFATIRP